VYEIWWRKLMAPTRFPVPDPTRIATRFPRLGLQTDQDAFWVNIEAPPYPLSRCEVLVGLVAEPAVTAAKRLSVHNSTQNHEVAALATHGANRGPAYVLVDKSVGDEIHLWKHAGGHFNDMYVMSSEFWGRLGGFKTTFTWVDDQKTGKPWTGNESWAYPVVTFPDGTLIATSLPTATSTTSSNRALSTLLGLLSRLGVVAEARTLGYVVYGGARFAIRDDAVGAQALKLIVGLFASSWTKVSQSQIDHLPGAPVDFTLLQNSARPGQESYIVYGRAKFPIPNSRWADDTLRTPEGGFLPHPGHSAGSVASPVPPKALAAIPNMPIDGTLLREENDAKVFLVKDRILHHVPNLTRFDELCLSARNVRVVPDNALAGFVRSFGSI
jgi:hypothetical protein